MIFSLFTESSAMNSTPVWEAVHQGLVRLGHQVRFNDVDAEVAVIWSQLWAGRMKPNLKTWQKFRATKRDVLVIEVGAIHRGETWRLLRNGEYRLPRHNHDQRAKTMGLTLAPWTQTGDEILIALQRPDSQQWHGQPDINTWLHSTVAEVRKYSQRPITIRPHPRYLSVAVPENCRLMQPQKLTGTYDGFDFLDALKHAWAVINWNSTPGTLAVMRGVPAFVSPTSIAASVANIDLSCLECPAMPDRQQWINDLAHTEWWLSEIADGCAIKQVMS